MSKKLLLNNFISNSSLKITTYTFTGEGVIPTFNEGYSYDFNDTMNEDGSTTRTIFNSENVYPTLISFQNLTTITDISYLASDDTLSTCNSMFMSCENLKSINLKNLNTSNVTDMSQMFYKDNSLEGELDVSSLNVSKVNTLEYTFANCEKLTSINLTGWNNTNNLNNMNTMFFKCLELVEIKGLESLVTKEVTTMKSTFNLCKKLTSLNINNWDTSNVTSMLNLFSNVTASEIILNKWNINKTTSLQGMFIKSTTKLIDISNFNVSGKNTTAMFMDLPSTTVVKVGSNFGKTEKDCSFAGTFTVI